MFQLFLASLRWARAAFFIRVEASDAVREAGHQNWASELRFYFQKSTSSSQLVVRASWNTLFNINSIEYNRIQLFCHYYHVLIFILLQAMFEHDCHDVSLCVCACVILIDG